MAFERSGGCLRIGVVRVLKFEDRFVISNGIRTRYWETGEGGPPLVLLHGLGGTIEDWAGTLRPLAQKRRVIAIDLLGCGQTDKPLNSSYSLQLMRAHVLATLDALDVGSFTLNGWSLGGRIALDLAHAEPDRVLRLILTAPAGVGRETILDLKAPILDILAQIAVRPGASGFRIMRNAVQNGNAVRLLRFAARRTRLVTDKPTRNAFQRQLRSILGPSGYLSKPRADLMSKLPQIKSPTLAVWGRQDAFAPFAHSKILLKEMPDCRLEAIERCGHTPHIEWPDIYANAVNTFLD